MNNRPSPLFPSLETLVLLGSAAEDFRALNSAVEEMINSIRSAQLDLADMRKRTEDGEADD
jgi:hypothetical protein